MDIEDWRGGSGTLYPYTVVEIGVPPNAEYGNYIFAKRTPAGGWEAVYMGHGDLSLRTDLEHDHRSESIRRPCTGRRTRCPSGTRGPSCSGSPIPRSPAWGPEPDVRRWSGLGPGLRTP